MNTPAHVAASVLVWRDEPGWASAVAVTTGALLPDLPMFGFYAYQKLWANQPEAEIWSRLYFEESWQYLFDVFNSIPLAALAIVICSFCKSRIGVLCGLSMLLHLLCDLPLHNDDAHRHFLPLTNWRFASPVSYWDPKHHGGIFIWVELAFAIVATSYVGWKGKAAPMRLAARFTLGLYVLGILFALVVWSRLSQS